MAQDNLLASVGKMGELKSRLWFVLGALVVYRLGAHIPVPGIDPTALKQLFDSQSGGILGMFNMFSGGALSRFTVFALGIMPYISASIIMQLVSVVSPKMEALKKEGEAGRRTITKYTRYGTVFLATFQALGTPVFALGAARRAHQATFVRCTPVFALGAARRAHGKPATRTSANPIRPCIRSGARVGLRLFRPKHASMQPAAPRPAGANSRSRRKAGRASRWRHCLHAA